MLSEAYKTYLLAVLTAQLPEAGLAWMEKQLRGVLSERAFFLAFSMVPRFAKGALVLTDEQVAQASQLRPGFNPKLWTVEQATRTVLLLQAPHHSPAEYTDLLNRLFHTIDLNESATLYAALPLLPYPETHVKRAAEGVRSTMTHVFDAIALNNPYPHDYLPMEAWNQMVLKAVFNARPLHQIYGLDRRRNAPLARMLVDYAHERWAAGRPLTPEVWRLVSPYLTTEELPDIQRLLRSSDVLENQAGTLALTECDLPMAKTLLRQHAATARPSNAASFNWKSIGERAYAS